MASTHQPWQWWSFARGQRSIFLCHLQGDLVKRSRPDSARERLSFSLKRVAALIDEPKHVYLCSVKEGLNVNPPSDRTEAERRVCHRHTAAHRLRLGALGCSWDNPSAEQHNTLTHCYATEHIRNTNCIDIWIAERTSCDFPLTVHISMGVSATLHWTWEWKHFHYFHFAGGFLFVCFSQVLFCILIPCCFWLSHSSCWAQRWPPWLPHTVHPFSHSATMWSSWRSPAPKTPSGLNLSTKHKDDNKCWVTDTMTVSEWGVVKGWTALVLTERQNYCSYLYEVKWSTQTQVPPESKCSNLRSCGQTESRLRHKLRKQVQPQQYVVKPDTQSEREHW